MESNVSFLSRLRSSVESAIIIGVKYSVLLIVLALTLFLLSADYMVVRQNSVKGAVAFDYINKQLEAQKQQQPNESK